MISNLNKHETQLIACIELVLMRRGNVHYNIVLAKLDSLYGYKIRDCYDTPEYLKTILKQVYEKNYNSVINEIRLELGDLGIEEINDFINIMLKQ